MSMSIAPISIGAVEVVYLKERHELPSKATLCAQYIDSLLALYAHNRSLLALASQLQKQSEHIWPKIIEPTLNKIYGPDPHFVTLHMAAATLKDLYGPLGVTTFIHFLEDQGYVRIKRHDSRELDLSV